VAWIDLEPFLDYNYSKVKIMSDTPERKGKCPRCNKAFTFVSLDQHKPFPFCCQRCKDIDLGKWVLGQYVISEKDIGSEETDAS
jgi:endogenous inhibitor of DNA gyrase (YacG/DUF329 family)